MTEIGVHKKLLGLFLATITVLTIMAIFIHLSIKDRETYHWVTQTYEVQNRIAVTLFDVETAQDAYEDYALNHSPDALNAFHTAFQKASVDLNLLQKQLAGNTLQLLRLRALRGQIRDFQEALEARLDGVKPPGETSPGQEFVLLENVHRAADGMLQHERDALEERTNDNRLSQRRVNIALICFLTVVSLLLVSLFAAVRQEVAQQLKAERQRHENAQKMANILENTSDAFLELNRDGIITAMNGHGERLLHGMGGNLIGQSLRDIDPGFVGPEFDAQCRQSHEEQVPVRFETFDASHGAWYEVHVYPNDGGLGLLLTDINERKTAEEQRERAARQAILHEAAKRRNQELQDLARRLVEMQEAERGHLAYELHEEIGQVLAGLKLSLAGILKQPEGAREDQVRAAQDLVTALMRQVRALSLDLRPGVLDDLGLQPALHWYCEHYAEQSGVEVDFTTQGLGARLDGTVETTAYRIVQEALACVAQRAEGKRVEVRLQQVQDRLNVHVVCRCLACPTGHNVCICDPASVTSMQERATLIGGSFDILSGPDQGTIITAGLPIHPIYTSLEV